MVTSESTPASKTSIGAKTTKKKLVGNDVAQQDALDFKRQEEGVVDERKPDDIGEDLKRISTAIEEDPNVGVGFENIKNIDAARVAAGIVNDGSGDIKISKDSEKKDDALVGIRFYLKRIADTLEEMSANYKYVNAIKK